DDKRHASLDRDAAQPGASAGLHGGNADGRQVGAPLLARLHGLDQHAAGPLALQPARALDQRIRAIDRLQAEHDALLDHDALPDIDGAARARSMSAPACASGATLPSGPSGASRLSRMLCTPTTRKPSSSSSFMIAL